MTNFRLPAELMKLKQEKISSKVVLNWKFELEQNKQ